MKKDLREYWSRIYFEPSGMNEPIKCYAVGMMGCKSIHTVHHGRTDYGMEISSYIVTFDDGTTKHISDTAFSVFD